MLCLHPLKNVFNYILWGVEASEDFEISFVHRGVEGGINVIRGDEVKEVGRSWFTISTGNDESFIPFHRVKVVKNVETGEVLWRNKRLV